MNFAAEFEALLGDGDVGGDDEPSSGARAKHIPLREPEAPATEAADTRTSIEKWRDDVRAAIAAAAERCLKRWHSTPGDLAATTCASRTAINLALKKERPLNPEPYLMQDMTKVSYFLSEVQLAILELHRKRAVVHAGEGVASAQHRKG